MSIPSEADLRADYQTLLSYQSLKVGGNYSEALFLLALLRLSIADPSAADLTRKRFTSVDNSQLTNAAQLIKPAPGTIRAWNFFNQNSVAVYVRVYSRLLADVTADAITGGTAIPVATILVPPGAGPSNPGSDIQDDTGFNQILCRTNAIVVRCSTGIDDTDNTAPAIPLRGSVRYTA